MADINHVTLVGRLTRDAELRASGQCESPEAGHARLGPRGFRRLRTDWPASSDTVDAPRVLKFHYWLVVLSPVHPDGIAASNRQQVGVGFAAIHRRESRFLHTVGRQLRVNVGHWKSDGGRERSDVAHTERILHHHASRRIAACNAHVCRRRGGLHQWSPRFHRSRAGRRG